MNLNERISKIIEYSELSSSEFADTIDVQRSNISHITSGRNKPSLDFLIKIKERFPEIQWDWLIKGEGEMLIKPEPEIIVEKQKPTSLPDLFSLIDDDNFGITESEDSVQKEIPRESKISQQSPEREKISDSQRLAVQEIQPKLQTPENQKSKIIRIVMFYDNGKFESFEP
ncbi:XRE family transcriptional regulator [Kaistella haifensis]|uniref:Transcriptional regulator n=1 Tax=Kaistella haifensis DSM 19056 TaxID=1450526 RepID=A0A2D0A641_9FLAO|nr:helix-turn-helix transcriptional regulator [Kaistella haifensis]AZB22615.1 XRE family transcriptional regulator [Kaistella haifensis]OWK97687.1 transcriptional regulator [Kaistella haifensis DSM 19056]